MVKAPGGREPGSTSPPVTPERGELGDRLRAARLKAGLSQSEVGSGKRQKVGDLENGLRTLPPEDFVRDVAERCGLEWSELRPLYQRAVPRRRHRGQPREAFGGSSIVSRYYRRADIEAFYVDVTYRIGPNRIPVVWDELIVLRPHDEPLEYVTQNYLYTGDAADRFIMSTDYGEVIDRRVTPATNYRDHLIKLPRAILPGETAPLAFQVRFDGAEQAPLPFFGFSIRRPQFLGRVCVLRLLFDPSDLPVALYEGQGRLYNAMDFDEERRALLPTFDHPVVERILYDMTPELSYGWRWDWAPRDAKAPCLQREDRGEAASVGSG